MSVLIALALGLRGLASARAEEVRRLNAELEERVRDRTQQLAASNEHLQRFASFLSHELKQPLSSQAVWIDLLASRLGGVDQESRHYLAELRGSALRMRDLLAAQLALAASDTARPSAPVELTALARGVLQALKPELEAAGAQVELEPLATVSGDAEQLRQLLRNLVENAIKYRSAERPLRIRIHARDADDDAAIFVEDNGRGLSPDQRERIFEPSVRLAPDGVAGDGLGLALCRSIAARHDGSIEVQSEPDAGATFTVRLPRAS
jgi:signal transduction histidine kinase